MSLWRALPRAFAARLAAPRRFAHQAAAPAAGQVSQQPPFRAKEPKKWDLALIEDGDTKIGLCPSGSEVNLVLPRSWLRDACRCHECVDPHSGQKNFATAQVPALIEVRETVKTPSGALRVVWESDFQTGQDHVSEYPADIVQSWLRVPYPHEEAIRTPQRLPELWDAQKLAERKPFYTYESFMQGGDAFREALDTLRLYGLFFLQGAPQGETTVEGIAQKLGLIQDTFYGRTWDVRSKPKAENVAYTSSFLGLHQDLLYMRNPPKLQLLHCLENSTQGGEALFSDGARAGASLKQINPAAWKTLREKPTVYRYDKGGYEFMNDHTTVTSDRREIFWSPPFQQPEQHLRKSENGASQHQSWLQALKLMQRLIEKPEYVFEYRYQPGDCVVFDNMRLLHGRKQFDSAAGARWLKGTYVDQDSYFNTLYGAAKVSEPEKSKVGVHAAGQFYAKQWAKWERGRKRRSQGTDKREAEAKEPVSAEGTKQSQPETASSTTGPSEAVLSEDAPSGHVPPV
ncbi:gamma-butyrobetaine dioxygenase [Microdochium nivale]|nr:gamma-butyrobetaine dioxygenase [Microdochium nivale]